MNHYRVLITISVVLMVSCEGEEKRRSATSYNFYQLKPILQNDLAENFRTLKTDNSTKRICDKDTCAKLTEITQQHILGSETSGLTEVLTRMDTKTTNYSQQIIDHYVPCLEKPATNIIHNIYTGEINLLVSSHLNCYTSYTQQISTYEMSHEIAFGKNPDEDKFYILDKGSIGTNLVTTTWLEQTPDTQLEIWTATNNPYTSTTATLAHMRITSADKTLEMTSAGLGSATQENPFTCGVQIKLNTSYLYVKGKIPNLSSECSAVSIDCNSLDTSDYCFAISDMTEQSDTSNCNSLKNFDLTAITPSNMDANTWLSKINVDITTNLPRMVLQGLEIQ